MANIYKEVRVGVDAEGRQLFAQVRILGEVQAANLGCMIYACTGVKGHLTKIYHKTEGSTHVLRHSPRYEDRKTDDALAAATHAYLLNHPEALYPAWEALLPEFMQGYGAVLLSSPINYHTKCKGTDRHYSEIGATTRGFVEWMRKTKSAVVSASPVFLNPGHTGATDLSLCQTWMIINPKYDSVSHVFGPWLSGKKRMTTFTKLKDVLLRKVREIRESPSYTVDLSDLEYFRRGPASHVQK